jgi:hypothetical protein
MSVQIWNCIIIGLEWIKTSQSQTLKTFRHATHVLCHVQEQAHQKM